MPLSCWSYLLGIFCLLIGVPIVVAPDAMSRMYRAFPRNRLAAGLLNVVAWIWAGYALWTMGLDIIEPYKRLIPFAVLVCIPLSWFWLENLLACRALGALLVLFPYELLHVARVHPSPWRLVVVAVAYACIVKGMILLLYPWKLRQTVVWLSDRKVLFRLAGGVQILLGLGLVILGAFVLR